MANALPWSKKTPSPIASAPAAVPASMRCAAPSRSSPPPSAAKSANPPAPARNLQLNLVSATAKHFFLIACDVITGKRVFRQLLILLVIVLLAVAVRSIRRFSKPGMARIEVEDYLRAKKLEFRQMCCVDAKEFRKIPWDDL